MLTLVYYWGWICITAIWDTLKEIQNLLFGWKGKEKRAGNSKLLFGWKGKEERARKVCKKYSVQSTQSYVAVNWQCTCCEGKEIIGFIKLLIWIQTFKQLIFQCMIHCFFQYPHMYAVSVQQQWKAIGISLDIFSLQIGPSESLLASNIARYDISCLPSWTKQVMYLQQQFCKKMVSDLY